ncbi:pollen-specific leucine-rich repeat extensin-like protein 2 isoform X1 [Papilio machaon]|uniref:pollen-specific leucine-rich repeat extensin-like protein 2 isoform X1 n=1 Tax=Papilio machaon TaxID=76193 RepID=UPI0006EB13EB|nr:pollen-specific leucine-rich repeat extensin-like protein 2 isoform X1 [Papilio machaon]
MQVTQADSGSRKRPGVNDTSPPNCDKMKKYIRSKIDHNETTSRASPPSPSDPYASSYVIKENVKPEVQPPLPLDPPPPDEPPNMDIELKKEIIDSDYQSPGEESPDALSQDGADLKSNDDDDDDDSDKPKPMCRDFIRGTCTRPGTCKFSHKCDISQLYGVYVFCRNYQNSVCTRPNCKYVHASVFEEQHFYRTGELPAHALAHHKKHILPPPPPPPPPQEAPPNIPPVFKVPPPPIRVRMTRPPPPISCIPTSKLEARPFADIRDSPSTSPLKREWPCINNCSSRDDGPDSESGQKRCRNCKYIELRFLHGRETLVPMNLIRAELMKEKCEKLQKATLEMHNQIDLLNKRREKLYSTLMTLFKPTYQAKPAATSGPISSPNSGERQTWLLEQMSSAINSNLIPGMQDDANRHIINGNPVMSSLVTKLLQVYRQHMLSDPSRKT